MPLGEKVPRKRKSSFIGRGMKGEESSQKAYENALLRSPPVVKILVNRSVCTF